MRNSDIFAWGVDKPWDIPVIKRQKLTIKNLMGFNYMLNTDAFDMTIHFFLDDYQFDRIWNRPGKYLPRLQKFNGCFSPDFSIYRNDPLVVSLFNIFRNRTVGCLCQMNGITVIPTVGWGDERTFDFCFKGVEKGSWVAISTIGVLDSEENKNYFMMGYGQLIEKIEPEKILIYGQSIPDLDWDITYYKPFVSKHREVS